jgi:hypothetical protein
MICERVREQIADVLAGRLDAAAREKFIDHLETCSACRAEVADLGVVWRGLDAMADPEPSPQMRARFMESLRAYEEGFQEAQRKQTYSAPRNARKPGWWAGLWPMQPAWGAAFAATMLVVGLLGGRLLLAPRAAETVANPELSQLRGQVESLRQLVALSLLQEQSPSARLRGVNYSYQMAQPDREVTQALLHAVNHDTNVNVRLSAVDALAKFATDPAVRSALIDSLPMQDSPMVQIALIDLLVQLNARDAAPAFQKLARQADANDSVRQRAASANEKLGGSQ